MKKVSWEKILPEGWEKMSVRDLETWYRNLDEETQKAWSYNYRMTGPICAEVIGHFDLTEEDRKKAEEWKEKIIGKV